jgi:hypothetical protein
MSWAQLFPSVLRDLQHRPPPAVLIIHCGSNDLVGTASTSLVFQMKTDLKHLGHLLPTTVFIWSDLLPRLYWHGARSHKGIDSIRKRVNRSGKGLVLGMGGRVINHPDIVEEVGLFRGDGVHLSDIGNDILLNDLQGALESFIKNSLSIYPHL